MECKIAKFLACSIISYATWIAYGRKIIDDCKMLKSIFTSGCFEHKNLRRLKCEFSFFYADNFVMTDNLCKEISVSGKVCEKLLRLMNTN